MKPGDSFDRYTIEAAIGQGGMGSVYRAHDARLGRRVALKVISDGEARPDATARLIREARAAATLDHPNVVAIFDVGERDGAPFIVMELVSGKTLREEMASGSSVRTRVGWMTDVGRALAAAHRRGLVHRDIKPENVMVRDDGVIKVLDFGIAKRAGGTVDPVAPTLAPAVPTLTVNGVNLGTPVYMSPEQIRGQPLDGRADQFAWGVTTYELLTGQLPWRGADNPLAVLASVLTDEPDPAALDRAGVSDAVKSIVLRALEKRPDDRFESMDEAIRALESGEVVAPRARAVRADRAPAQAPGATLAARYSTAEVKAILSRAVERQEAVRADDRLGFDDLLTAAREVGVDDAVLREASRELRSTGSAPLATADDNAARNAWFRRKRRALFRHVGVFAIVMGALQAIGLLTGAFPWTLIPAIAWAIAVGIHGLHALSVTHDDWDDERERRRKREARARRRGAVVDRAIEEGAAVLLQTGESLRRRLAVSPAEAARIRVSASRASREQEPEAAEARAAAEQSERNA